MKLYADIGTNSWGLGIEFYHLINIYDRYKFAMEVTILCLTIDLHFYKKGE